MALVLVRRTPEVATCWGGSSRPRSATSQEIALGNKQCPVGTELSVGFKRKTKLICSGDCLSCGRKVQDSPPSQGAINYRS